MAGMMGSEPQHETFNLIEKIDDDDTKLNTTTGSTSSEQRSISNLSAMETQACMEENTSNGASSCCNGDLPIRDLIISLVIGYGGVYGTKHICSYIFEDGYHHRPIPYQVLSSSGDVVLDLGLNHVLVEKSTVPSRFNFHTSVTLVLIILCLISQLRPIIPEFKRHDTISTLCVLFTATGMSEFITGLIKAYVGRLRPNFYNLCKFDIELLQCTADPWVIKTAYSSFPSNHSSLAFTGMGVLVFFFLGRQRIYDAGGRSVLPLICFLPWAYSSFVASSRLVDNWHHPSDILAGTLLGIFCSTVSYHLWYPSVLSPNSSVPLTVIFNLKNKNVDIQ